MIPAYLLPRTVARIRPASSVDSYGNTVRDYTVPPAISIDIAAWLQQEGRRELLAQGRDPLEQQWLMISNESDVSGYDRVVFGSLIFEVDGPPELVYVPAGFHHLEATLKIVEG